MSNVSTSKHVNLLNLLQTSQFPLVTKQLVAVYMNLKSRHIEKTRVGPEGLQ